MFDKQSSAIFLGKVPDFGNPWKVMLTLLYTLLLSVLCGVFFYYIDCLSPYAALISQGVMAVVVAIISYLHFKWAGAYRQKYGTLAYRYFFYHLMIPYLVTWYACFFHPLFVRGSALLPVPLAVGLGSLFLILTILANVQIERAGFHEVTHGLDVYTVFPEEATLVHGEIYGYIRHPLYFSLLCGSVGLAFLSNNVLAVAVALLQLIPILAAGYMEDRELVARAGDEHRQYIGKTNMLIPVRHLGGFFKLLVFLG